jgi:hypothetical protein
MRSTIHHWLIKLRGAAGADMKIVFDGKAELIVSLDDFRRDNPARASKTSTLISDAALRPALDGFLERCRVANETLSSWLVTKRGVDERRRARAARPRLRLRQRGWSDLGDGVSFYKWLHIHGSTQSKEAQRMLTCDWSVLLAEAHLRVESKSATKRKTHNRGLQRHLHLKYMHM